MNRFPANIILPVILTLLGAERLSAQPVAGDTVAGDPLDQTSRAPRIKFGPIVIGEDHPIFSLDDFPVRVDDASSLVNARWEPNSVKWVRTWDDLPMPLARLHLSLRAPAQRGLIYWRGRAVVLEDDPAGTSSAEVFVPLLESEEVQVAVDGKPAADIHIGAKAATSTPPNARHAIDHSCSPWSITISGLDDAFLAMNCKLVPVGDVGSEETLVDIHWAVAGVTLPGGNIPPLSVQLRRGHPARMTVIGPDGKSRTVEIAANLPPRWHRLKLAVGLGPYGLSSSGSGNGAAGSLMLYGNLKLHHDDDLSIRFFEAAVSQSPSVTTLFNNFGFYFAYDVADVWDSRLRLDALLGAQAVTFAPSGLSHKSFSQGLYPQGFEVSYLDAFGKRNYRLTGGAFVQPSRNIGYQNYWVRYGTSWFGEVNYISWQSGDRHARIWGLSAGIPFLELF